MIVGYFLCQQTSGNDADNRLCPSSDSNVRDDSNVEKIHFTKLVRLDRAWKRGDPDQVRQECGSFVLSLEIVHSRQQLAKDNDTNGNDDTKSLSVIIGLNNGLIQEWELTTTQEYNMCQQTFGGIGLHLMHLK